MDYCTTCGSPVTGEPLIPDRGQRLCWLCADSQFTVPREVREFVEDYADGQLDREHMERARLEAEGLMEEMPEQWKERQQRQRARVAA